MPPETLHIRDGIRHLHEGRPKDAEAVFRDVLAAAPEDAGALHLLGMLCQDSGRNEEAMKLLGRALQRHPEKAEFHNNLGTVLGRLNREPEAAAAFAEAVRLRPGYAEALANLCTALLRTGRVDDAAAAGRKALAARPDSPRNYTALAAALRRQGRIAEAIDVQKKGTALGLDYPEAHNDLASSLLQQGRLAEAIAAFRRAVELAPGDAALHSNLLFALNYHPAITPGELFAEHQKWAKVHAEPLSGEIVAHGNDRTPGRRLRVGYVSADFREHTRALFMEAVLAAHDKTAFEVFCYSGARKPDGTTARIRAAADARLETAALGDAELAAMVRADKIDILVELTGHMANNRLLVFARKPAPVQVSYPGYPNTTGLRRGARRRLRVRPAGAVDLGGGLVEVRGMERVRVRRREAAGPAGGAKAGRGAAGPGRWRPPRA